MKFSDRVVIVPYNIFFDDTKEIAGLMDKVHWDGIKLPAVFVGDEPVTSGYIDETAVSEALLRSG